MLHLGLGAFHRAHQAWYTWAADPGREWGISGFTGRRPDTADLLRAQDGLYTLIERGPEHDRFDIITSIAEAHDGADLATFTRAAAAPETSAITLTVSEAGYRSDRNGHADASDPLLQHDAGVLRDLTSFDATRFSRAVEGSDLRTVPGRLLAGLERRRRADAGPLAVVSCDNVASNGTVLRQVLLDLAQSARSEAVLQWLNTSVSFVETSVDRITPATTDGDIASVMSATGWYDLAPVVTESFTNWILSGAFPGGRPDWELAGASFVDRIEPFEQRKLWLLNGAHSLLAYAGLAGGHRTVADAIADPRLRAAVEAFWDEATENLDPALPDLGRYRADLVSRFSNGRIEHRLAQIAADGTVKLRLRIAPVARAERARGRSAAASASALAGWIGCLRAGIPLADPRSGAIRDALATGPAGSTAALMRLIDPELADDAGFMVCVADRLDQLTHTLPL